MRLVLDRASADSQSWGVHVTVQRQDRLIVLNQRANVPVAGRAEVSGVGDASRPIVRDELVDGTTRQEKAMAELMALQNELGLTD